MADFSLQPQVCDRQVLQCVTQCCLRVFECFSPDDPKVKYPLCIEGEQACTPEDCGGPWVYADYLAALGDPKHWQHDQMLEWRGPFDPEAFDAKKATKEIRKIK